MPTVFLDHRDLSPSHHRLRCVCMNDISYGGHVQIARLVHNAYENVRFCGLKKLLVILPPIAASHCRLRRMCMHGMLRYFLNRFIKKHLGLGASHAMPTHQKIHLMELTVQLEAMAHVFYFRSAAAHHRLRCTCPWQGRVAGWMHSLKSS